MNNLAADFWCLFFPVLLRFITDWWHPDMGHQVGALLLPPWFFFCSCAQVLATHQLQGQENLLHIRFATILCIGWIPWAFSLAQCPAIESAKINGDGLSLFCFHHVQCYSCKLVLLSCTIDLILNFFFLFLAVGQCSQWCLNLCREKAPGGAPRLKHLLHLCSQRSKFCYPGDALLASLR